VIATALKPVRLRRRLPGFLTADPVRDPLADPRA